MLNILKKGALGRLFLCLGLLLPIAACGQAEPLSGSSASCTGPAGLTSISVRSAHDGDTLTLGDGRKVRLIGIDTPELKRGQQPAQPYALQARDYLRALLAQHQQRVSVVLGRDAKDHYGRTLAHLFFDDGSSVQAAMLSAGYAVAMSFPPNTAYSTCYQEQEKLAREANRQIWSHPKYRDRDIRELKASSSGFHILHGRVNKISHSRVGIWLNLEGGLSVQIKTADLDNFAPGWLDALSDKTVQLRGWLHPKLKPKYHQRFYLQLRHPDNLQIVSN